jgi:hypothetical protein
MKDGQKKTGRRKEKIKKEKEGFIEGGKEERRMER